MSGDGGRGSPARSRAVATELSLVVATRDRAHRLPAFFEEVAAIRSERAWELVVVDNGSTDDTRNVVEAFGAAAAIPVRYVAEPRPGLGRALNAGVRAARGAVVATTDDDCYPDADYPDRVLETFERHAIGFMGGRVRLHDEADAPVSILDREETVLLPAPSFPYPGFIGGANLAFRRAVFDDVGGFDDRFGAGTPFPCEDADFCARASVRGWDGGFFPEPVVRHHHGRRTAREVAEVKRGYARARGAYYAKTLLDLPPLRHSCLRWWYWSLDSTPLRYTALEVASGLRYLVHRLGRVLAN